MAEAGDPVRRRLARLLHVPPLALLLGLGLAPPFILFPLLPGGPEHDPTLRPVELWLGTALLGGLAGAVEGAARPLYRVGALVLTASLLSIPAMRLALRAELPLPRHLAAWLGLDGEHALDAALYEVWLVSWLACLGAVLLGLLLLRRAGRGRRGPRFPGIDARGRILTGPRPAGCGPARRGPRP